MENLSLYQITSSFPKLIEEEMSEEDKKEVKKELTELLQQKSQNLIGYIRNIELTIEAMKNEEKRISEQRKVLESRLTKFKEYVKECMEQNGFTKIETQLGALSIVKNPISVEIYDEAQIPDEYKTKVIEIKVDKTAIKKALKETGEIIPGTRIINNKTSLRIEDVNLKIMVWGESGSGKSRFALSSPNPIVVDLEGSTRLYANQFDFYKAEVNKTDNRASNPATLTVNLIEEILEGKYPDRKTLIIDPVTDLLDCIEDVSAKKYEQMIGKKVGELNQLQKTKWYAYRREMARTVLNQLKDIPMNLILVARAKNVWDTKDGKMQPVGLTYDALDIVEYLMDIVIQLEKTGEETKAIVKKSRIGNLPKILDVKDYSSIEKALKAGSEKLAEGQE